MANDEIINRFLDFREGDASHGWNTLGDPNVKNVMLRDYFTGIALDTTNDWAAAEPGSGDSWAITEIQGGAVLGTTGTVDNDSIMLSSAVIFSGSKRAWCEVDLTITTVAGIGVCVGFSDEKAESNNSMAFQFDDGTFSATATDGACIVIDADELTSSINAVSAQTSGGATTPVDMGDDWTDGQRRTIRIEYTGDGTRATYRYWNSDGTGTVRSAQIPDSATAATLMCVTIQAITRAGSGGGTVRVHSVKAGQDL
ncbi:hypothetical protein LCGC14_2303460 [marine sediment metagenome]|uniref:Uncharacterized protein n=1 Tax=marine sediment metagenome TaxID=412755 RepID=A0A0F9DA85_9ZZZZ